MYGGQSSHLPLKVNGAGVIPPIFASSLLMFPAHAREPEDPGRCSTSHQILRPATGAGTSLYVTLIIFFAFFYTAIQFQPVRSPTT